VFFGTFGACYGAYLYFATYVLWTLARVDLFCGCCSAASAPCCRPGLRLRRGVVRPLWSVRTEFFEGVNHESQGSAGTEAFMWECARST